MAPPASVGRPPLLPAPQGSSPSSEQKAAGLQPPSCLGLSLIDQRQRLAQAQAKPLLRACKRVAAAAAARPYCPSLPVSRDCCVLLIVFACGLFSFCTLAACNSIYSAERAHPAAAGYLVCVNCHSTLPLHASQPAGNLGPHSS